MHVADVWFRSVDQAAAHVSPPEEITSSSPGDEVIVWRAHYSSVTHLGHYKDTVITQYVRQIGKPSLELLF